MLVSDGTTGTEGTGSADLRDSGGALGAVIAGQAVVAASLQTTSLVSGVNNRASSGTTLVRTPGSRRTCHRRECLLGAVEAGRTQVVLVPSDSSLVTVSSSRTGLTFLDTVSLFPGVGSSFRTRSGVHLSFWAVVTSGALHFVSDSNLTDTVVPCVTGSTLRYRVCIRLHYQLLSQRTYR